MSCIVYKSSGFFIMTNTERQQKIQQLQKEFDAKRMELAWIQTEIMALSAQVDCVTDDLVSIEG